MMLRLLNPLRTKRLEAAYDEVSRELHRAVVNLENVPGRYLPSHFALSTLKDTLARTPAKARSQR
jgi:hypothetical protein